MQEWVVSSGRSLEKREELMDFAEGQGQGTKPKLAVAQLFLIHLYRKALAAEITTGVYETALKAIAMQLKVSVEKRNGPFVPKGTIGA